MHHLLRPIATGALIAATTLCFSGCSSEDTGVTQSTASSASKAPSTDPVRAAEKVFTTWNQPSLDYATWWGGLEPLLALPARQAYLATDPANIPEIRVTGPYRLAPEAPDDPETTALVHVPTDRGAFGLFMQHAGPEEPWFLLQIEFPPGIH